METRYNEQIRKQDFDWDFGMFIAMFVIIMTAIVCIYV